MYLLFFCPLYNFILFLISPQTCFQQSNGIKKKWNVFVVHIHAPGCRNSVHEKEVQWAVLITGYSKGLGAHSLHSRHKQNSGWLKRLLSRTQPLLQQDSAAYMFCCPNSRARNVAASTASISALRKPFFSSTWIALMVVPAGEQTSSLSWPGCFPVSTTILAAPWKQHQANDKFKKRKKKE